MKKSLIIGIILIIICLGLTVYEEFINKPVNINTITNKKINILTIFFIPNQLNYIIYKQEKKVYF